eukprot:m.36183 g.36183  ORF g.36183 m.36183 type:complete len:530 (+) comp12457_c0_seq1:139-1728(+)
MSKYKAVLEKHRTSFAPPLAVTRASKTVSKSNGGFLALVNGTSLEVLDMEGPSASWVVRDHQGEVGFVKTEDMVLEYYNLNNTELQEMMDKTTAEVLADDLHGRSELVYNGNEEPIVDDDSPVKQAPRGNRKSKRALSVKAEPVDPKLLQRKQRSVSYGSAISRRSSQRKLPEGHVVIGKGQEVEVLDKSSSDVPDGFWVVRTGKGEVGLVPEELLEYDASAHNFGADLTAATRAYGGQVPPVLRSSVAWLTEHALTEEGLFRVPGRTAVVNELKHGFENDDDLLAASDSRRKYNPEDVATLLKLYLRSLPNPVFPSKLYMTFAEIAKIPSEDDRLREVKETLLNYVAPAHVAVLKMILPFLHEVSLHAEVNKMDANNLGLVFGPTLMRASNLEALESIEASSAMIDHEPRIKALMALLIRRHKELFPSPSNSCGSSTASSSLDSAPVFEDEAADDEDPRSWTPQQVADWVEAAPASLDAESKAKLATKDGEWLVNANQAELKALGLPMKDVMQMASLIYALTDPRAKS